MDNKVLVITGPTASGKSALAYNFAKKYNGEIISADSMQIYKYMDIGTAKATVEQMQTIPHHLMDFISPLQHYTLADYLCDADICIKDVLQRGKVPIVVGGTGLYISSLVDNIKLTENEHDEQYRNYLNNLAKKYGGYVILQLLKSVDSEASLPLHENDTKRIARGLEVLHETGETITIQRKRSKLVSSPYDFYMIGINFKERNQLYSRIDKRVDEMFENGLVDEVKRLKNMGMYDETSTAYQAIGYRQFHSYFDGNSDLNEISSRIKQETRHYAKRQLTWFRRDDRIHWIYVDDNNDAIFDEMLKKLQKDVEFFLKV